MAVQPTQFPERLYRIGRDNPFQWPDRVLREKKLSRFDDPRAEYGVLYAAESPLACFIETLDRFRPSLRILQALARANARDPAAAGLYDNSVDADWAARREIGRFRLRSGRSWLDMRSLDAHQLIRHELTDEILALGFDAFDCGEALTRRRPLTQAISRWAYQHGYHGIVYKSRLDLMLDCWAIFAEDSIEEGNRIAEDIAVDDPDFNTALATLGLRLAGN